MFLCIIELDKRKDAIFVKAVTLTKFLKYKDIILN